MENNIKDRPFVRFSNEGQKVFNEWFENLHINQIENEDNPLIEEHLCKYKSLMPSLSLIFHLIEVADGKSTDVKCVSAENATLAIACVRYLETHARRIYAVAESPEFSAAIILSQKIKAHKVPSPFTAKYVYDKGWHALSNAKIVNSACAILIEKEWLKVGDSTKNVTGRPPAKEYIINPVFTNSPDMNQLNQLNPRSNRC